MFDQFCILDFVLGGVFAHRIGDDEMVLTLRPARNLEDRILSTKEQELFKTIVERAIIDDTIPNLSAYRVDDSGCYLVFADDLGNVVPFDLEIIAKQIHEKLPSKYINHGV